MAHPALLWKNLGRAGSSAVQCRLCAQHCTIKPGKLGKCFVRKNVSGALKTLSWGQVRGLAVDPIEKKPFFHFRPGSRVLSFGTPGCNFSCLGCQNWDLSQGPKIIADALEGKIMEPAKVVELARNTDGLAYTYSEPTIFFEYAYDCIKLSKKVRKMEAEPSRGWTRSRAGREGKLYNVFVSNGYLSEELIAKIKREKLLDAIRIDLKFMDEKNYKEYCGARLEPVLENIRSFARSRVHLEVMVLVIPGMNDGKGYLKRYGEFIASVDSSIPLHFLRFFPHFRAANPATPDDTLLLARGLARDAGVQHVYIGNSSIPGGEDTLCPGCGGTLIQREGFSVAQNRLERNRCPDCGKAIKLVL